VTSEKSLSKALATIHNVTTGRVLNDTDYTTGHRFVFSQLTTGNIYDL